MELPKTIFTYSINSSDATIYRSSSDFMFRLPRFFNKVDWIKLLGGNIPNTSEPFLYVNISDEIIKNIYSSNGHRYDGILRYRLPATSTQNLIDMDKTQFNMMGPIEKIDQFNVRLFDKYGKTNSFGLDTVNINSFSNANPSVITTSVNHLLVPNDIVLVRGFDNGSSIGLNATINETRWEVVAVGAPNTITIRDASTSTILDLSGDAASQPLTGFGQTYPLGSTATVVNKANQRKPITLISQNGLETQIQTSITHNLSVGNDIKIEGMDNGFTPRDNNVINQRHYVSSIVDPNNFTISRQISSYVTPRAGTDEPGPYILGSKSILYVEKYQCTFDILIQAIK